MTNKYHGHIVGAISGAMRHVIMRPGCIGHTATIYLNRQLRPVLKYGHLHTVPRVALLQALYCT